MDADLNSKEFLAEWKLSPDDVLELSRMPVVQGTYYNPVEKELITDQELLKVIVDPLGSVEQSARETEERWCALFVQLSYTRITTLFFLVCFFPP